MQDRLFVINMNAPEGTCITLDTEMVFKRKRVWLELEKNFGRLEYMSGIDLSRTRKMTIVIESCGRRTTIELPHKMSINLAKYFSGERTRTGRFDCGTFINFMHGIDGCYGYFDRNRWNFSDLVSTESLNTGDTVMFSSARNKFDPGGYRHLAIYLANEVFLSKFGADGGLIVNDINQLRRGFGGDNVFLIKPKLK